MFFLCVYLFFLSVHSFEITTNPNGRENSDVLSLSENTTSSKNETGINETNTNISIVTQRIIQPIQTQKIERIFESPVSSNDSLKIKNKTNNLGNFKPSPQLETYYEFNKFPVLPALPEPKTLGSFGSSDNVLSNWNEKSSTWSNNGHIPNSWYENPRRQNSWNQNVKINTNPSTSHRDETQGSWYENPRTETSWNQNIKVNTNPTTEPPWMTRVKFPSEVVKDTPYKFVNSDEKFNSYLPTVSFTTTTEGFSFNKPVDTTKRNKPSLSLWQKLMGGTNILDKNVAAQKTFLDYNMMEKPPHYSPVKDYNDYGVSSHGSPNPLTKIIKFLTTIIPIGLLISALTPTIITVTSMNDTQSRYRADDPKRKEIANRLASSLKYVEQFSSCEDKILCELLVSASTSKNSEEHIKNLLDTFTEHEDIQNKKEELLKVFEAVRKEDCSSIVCKSSRNPS